ncbi:hypothetical protein H6G54_16390 [Anabaena cylindrica FACHB-243]|uniref:Uncharacterized protein n=1 Tax=Anabaena cylindrica (strain ATCC 27899 / PCC 7122) TaxID=272123 RepID=K9ZHL7_ANACC|nr:MULTISPECIES: hypothetical protein [Anabaena]AFZ57840.1 hypothetical protein Anacy_2386 [Anabaena cylindrica PCC 7122]MBD2419249.1 hypothetical protein [Anabaena cylindrica FACHB-243]MBY5284075.1 hypothetical protein [Anabaena sp. CCAP 1446/1C]MBY5311333.1 hypothetical protein [Anabaena sp. CCAP 1446/1C]MCM2408149.1 hypothetical protein [Anabaena sp. CCAP 1446/1C]
MDSKDPLLQAVLLITNLWLFWYFIKGKTIKVDEQTQAKLDFTIQPKLLRFIGLFIGQIAIICLYSTLIATPITQLNCNRVPQNIDSSIIAKSTEQKTSLVICKLVELDWFSHEKSQKHISELIGASLEKQSETDSDGKKIYYKYRIQLITNTESFPFRQAYRASRFIHEELESIISQINNFLAQPLEKKLLVQEDDRSILVAITIFFSLLPLIIIGAGLFISCNFNKEANSLILSRYRWFGIFGKGFSQYSLNEIVNIKVESRDSDEGGFTYRVILILESGEIVPLSHVYSSGFEEKQQIVNIVKTFLSQK